MKISNTADCSAGTYEAFSTTKNGWSHGVTNATATVSAIYRDAAGNETERRLDGFVAFDFTAPDVEEGTARFLPKGARLRFQIHYTTNGEAAKDQTRLGLIFAKEKPRYEMRSMGVYNVGVRIPPGASNHRQRANRLIPVPGRIYSFTPHMHVRGKAFRYEAKLPGGTRQMLLDIPRYDFNWQLSYLLAEPLDVPGGTRIHATAWYDNSEDNPANPDPTKLVRWGEQTWEEMLIGYLDWHPIPPDEMNGTKER